MFSRWGDSHDRASKIFGLASTLVVSAGLCLSDWCFAAYFRSEAAALAATLPRASTLVSGGWGWQWYATQDGFREIDERSELDGPVQSSVLHPGDYLVVPDGADHYEPLYTAPSLHAIRIDTQGGPLLNLFCTDRGGRFYVSNAIIAPWSLSRDCLNYVTVYQVGSGE